MKKIISNLKLKYIVTVIILFTICITVSSLRDYKTDRIIDTNSSFGQNYIYKK